MKAPSIRSFPGKHKDEKIILVLRRHWIVFFKHIALTTILFLIPPFIYLLDRAYAPGLITPSIQPIIALAASTYYLFLLTYFYIWWLDYYLDVWIVTDERIIDVEQNGLFRRVVSEQNIYRVQDVTAEVHGVIQTFFNFGTIAVQTAGVRQRFTFEQIPDPYLVKKIIIRLHDIRIREEQQSGSIFTRDDSLYPTPPDNGEEEQKEDIK